MAAQCSGILLFFLLPVVLTYVFTLTVAFNDPFFQRKCVKDAGNYTTNSAYERDLNSTFNDMLSTTAFKYGFYRKQFGEVNAIALCRGDAKLDACSDCINGSISLIKLYCPRNKEVIGWSEYCMIRYSNRSIAERLELSPPACLLSTQNETNPDRNYFYTLTALLEELRTKAASSGKLLKYAAANSTLGAFQSLFALEQCTPDLSEADCNNCLSQAINTIDSCCNEKIGCRILTPSCNLRFESAPFFGDPPAVPKENTTVEKNPAEKKQNKSSWIPLAASLSAALGLTLFSACGFFIWRKRYSEEDIENSQEVQLLELVGGTIHNEYSGERTTKSQEFPSIKLDTLHAATNHFSTENKLGEGGFGPVYKGLLPDGKEIAVKRLSKTSGQGLLEFKNEVILIAKLQHKNLVRLLGCCLEKKEKLLVYEFMPNRSLDVLLFDSNTATQLDWQKRFGIIKGIARGVMYLHEDSRLRIIHRDLKASNVLLDHEMNPKISDFGMARIFSADQNDANTNRVVGTYGYMAPEYAMEGQFSIKSDVFSFGVLLLEIICGKKNNGFHHSGNGESLLTYAWKLWSKGEGMELVDQTLSQSRVVTEVLKCIHIGLLCVQDDPADRPTMTSVVVMLASETITFPRPSEPAYFVRRRAVAEPSPTQQSTSNGICSVNEVTFSNLSPR